MTRLGEIPICGGLRLRQAEGRPKRSLVDSDVYSRASVLGLSPPRSKQDPVLGGNVSSLKINHVGHAEQVSGKDALSEVHSVALAMDAAIQGRKASPRSDAYRRAAREQPVC